MKGFTESQGLALVKNLWINLIETLNFGLNSKLRSSKVKNSNKIFVEQQENLIYSDDEIDIIL